MTFSSPNRDDIIDLPDLSHLHTDKDKPSDSHINKDFVREEYIDQTELEDSIYQTALQRVKSGEFSKIETSNNDCAQIGSTFDKSEGHLGTQPSLDISEKCCLGDTVVDQGPKASVECIEADTRADHSSSRTENSSQDGTGSRLQCSGLFEKKC